MLNAWRVAHIAAGSVALATFWIPLAAFKGGRLHRAAGRTYAWSMLVVVVAAIGVAAWRLLYDMAPAARPRSIFLSFVALLTFAAGWNGLRALRTKRRRGPSADPLDLVPSATLALCGVAMALWGSTGGFHWLPVIFGVFGAVLGGQQLAEWRSIPADPHHWVYQHLRGMMIACIATVTAFLVVNAHSIGLATFGVTVWVLPGIAGGIGIGVLSSYYHRRFARPGEVVIATERAAARNG
jgi:hypothetical protein